MICLAVVGDLPDMPDLPDIMSGNFKKKKSLFIVWRGVYLKHSIRNTGGAHQSIIMQMGVSLCHLW